MSKTDKTIPWRVAELYYGEEDHDHRTGGCDLDEYNPLNREKKYRGWYWNTRPCYLNVPYYGYSGYKWPRESVVGEYAREENRKIRHNDKRALRRIINNDIDADDTNFGRPRRNAEWLAY